MATLYVTEFADVGTSAQGAPMQVGAQPYTAQQTVTYTGTAGVSSAFHASTRIARIHTDGICSIRFGTAPTAVTTDARLVAGQTEYFTVPCGKAFKVSAVVNT